jgi:hypothetical protein
LEDWDALLLWIGIDDGTSSGGASCAIVARNNKKNEVGPSAGKRKRGTPRRIAVFLLWLGPPSFS